MNLKFNLLQKNDSDIPFLKEMHESDAIKKYISISETYFDYVTSQKHIRYYKVLQNNIIIGSVHLENDGEMLYLSVCVHPMYQSKGYGRRILQYVSDKLTDGAEEIHISIAADNEKSIKLFESFGFVFIGTEDSLRNYIYKLK